MSSERILFFFFVWGATGKCWDVVYIFTKKKKKLVLYLHLINGKEGVRGRKECAQEEEKNPGMCGQKKGTSI